VPSPYNILGLLTQSGASDAGNLTFAVSSDGGTTESRLISTLPSSAQGASWPNGTSTRGFWADLTVPVYIVAVIQQGAFTYQITLYTSADLFLWTSLPVASGMGDVSGIARASATGTIFVADGAGQNVWRLPSPYTVWSAVALSAGHSVYDLTVADDGSILVNTNNGVFRSQNDGLTWNQVYPVNASHPTVGFLKGAAGANPSLQPGLLLAIDNQLQAVVVSTNDGLTWTVASMGTGFAQVSNITQNNMIGRLPAGNFILADQNGPGKELVSTDATGTAFTEETDSIPLTPAAVFPRGLAT
jgi:hypothetical protein